MKSLFTLFFILPLFTACPSAVFEQKEVSTEVEYQSEDMDSSSEIPQFKQTGGTTFYVSAHGSDSNSGVSPESPWQSIDKLNSELMNFNPGDRILFRRGDLFKGFLEPARGEANNWIQYSCYGSGEKPIISGAMDFSLSSDWVHSSVNIWRTLNPVSRNGSVYDVGAVFYNVHESAGFRRWSMADLLYQGDFYFEPVKQGTIPDDPYLYLYSFTNPGSYYDSIEASLRKHLVSLQQRSYLLFQGLHFTQGAAHGFGGSNNHHIIIKDCDFSYIGGGYLFSDEGKPVRYGNGVEFWEDSHNNLVENNRFWEIYDTALTNQGRAGGVVQQYLFYRNNIIWNCGLAGFELWLQSESSEMSHIYFIHNTVVNPGQGWGGETREDKNSFHIAAYYNVSNGTDLVIKNNIFYSDHTPDNAENHLFFYDDSGASLTEKFSINNNLWYMPDPLWIYTSGSTFLIFNSLYQWESATGFSSQGLFGDPLLKNISSRDFSLNSDSIAIDKGAELHEWSRDFLGNEALGKPDIGALEYFQE